MNKIDELAIKTIRIISAEAVQKANSGHPGLPMGAAPMAYTLWAKHLKHNPENSNWIDRDRFVLSAGHGSMLLYSPVSYTHLRAHETRHDLVCRLLLEKKKKKTET